MSKEIIKNLKSMGYRFHSKKENLYAKPFGYHLLVYSVEKRILHNIFAVNGKLNTYSTDNFEELSASFTGNYENDFLAMLKYTESSLGFVLSKSACFSRFEFMDNVEAYSLILESEDSTSKD